MLQVTPEATQHLLRVRRERGLDDADSARFVRQTGRIGLTFTRSPEADDQFVDGGEIPIYLAADVAPALEDSVIDARPDDGRTVLVIRKPAATSTG
jgi:Fe-S cluster assembly iron-binding protein IscA